MACAYICCLCRNENTNLNIMLEYFVFLRVSFSLFLINAAW